MPGVVNGFLPRRKREMKTSVVSKMGMPMTMMGTIHVTNGTLSGKRSLMPMAASMKPRNRLPVSPMKIDAGLKL